MRVKGFACVVAVCLAGGVLTGCGGSSAPSASSAQVSSNAQQARPTPARSNADRASVASPSHRAQPSSGSAGRASAAGGSGAPRRAAAGIAPLTVHKAKPTPAATRDDQNSSAPKPLNPCSLVSVSEAQTITGGSVTSSVEAPLGPTCIYRGQGTGITMAIETQKFSQVTHQMLKRTPVTVAGRQAFCGRLGAQILFVPLGKNRLLNVTAPCAIAQRFAALAMSHLSA